MTMQSMQEVYRHLQAMNAIAPKMQSAAKAAEAHEDRIAALEAQVNRMYPIVTDQQKAMNQVFMAEVRGNAGSGSARPPMTRGEPVDLRQEVDAIAAFARTGNQIHNIISTAEPSEGGYTVLPSLSDALRVKLHDSSALVRLAGQATLDRGNTWLQPVNTDLAGATWVGEKDARPNNTAPTFEQAEIKLEELASNVPITQRALDDSSYDLGVFLQSNMFQQFARSLGDAVLNGDGIKKPKGLMTYPTAAQADGVRPWFTLEHIDTGVDGAFGANPGDQLVDLMFSLRAVYRANARWMMTRKTAALVRKIKDSEGRYLWGDALSEGQPATLLGHPVELDDYMPEIGAGANAIAFGDFNECYTVLQRGGIRVLRDPLTVKGTVQFYAYARFGGGVINSEAVKFLRFGVTPQA